MSIYQFKTKFPGLHRIQFDPANRQHRLDFAEFLKYNNWRKGCRFYLEDPYTNVADMCKEKLLNHYLKDLMELV
jgi:hypothetical protein